MIEKLWTPEEIASTLRVDAATVRRWLRDGELEGLKLGRQWRVGEAAFQTFLEERRNQQADEDGDDGE